MAIEFRSVVVGINDGRDMCRGIISLSGQEEWKKRVKFEVSNLTNLINKS